MDALLEAKSLLGMLVRLMRAGVVTANYLRFLVGARIHRAGFTQSCFHTKSRQHPKLQCKPSPEKQGDNNEIIHL